jgi:hypothetical protein
MSIHKLAPDRAFDSRPFSVNANLTPPKYARGIAGL